MSKNNCGPSVKAEWSAEALVEAQRRLVLRLANGSHGPSEAEKLLATFERSLEVINANRAAIAHYARRRSTLDDAKPWRWSADRSPEGPDHADAARVQLVVDQQKEAIAQVLHDEFGQHLALLKIDLSNLESTLLKREDTKYDAVPMMHGLYSHIDAAITSTRRIAFELRPAVLDGLDLEAAIKALASQFSSRSRIDVHCQIRAETAALSQSAATSIYRIVQEALTNTARHAQASRANVELYQFRDAYVLRIQDDGIGATRDKEAPPQSLGLRGMRERVRALNGSMGIETSPGNGYTIAISLPKESLI